MTRTLLILIAAGGSAALLLGALGFQYIGGLSPCHLCLEQRWPHLAAVLIGLVALFFRARFLPILGALAAATTSALGLYHTGVERKWWEGPQTCTSGDITALSPDKLMDQILTAPLVQCDQVQWEFLGLSMASWNAILSLGLVFVWLAAWRASLSAK